MLKNKKITSALKLLVSIFFLYLAITKIDIKLIKDIFNQINLSQILSLSLLIIFHFLINALRWNNILKTFKTKNTINESFTIYFNSLFLNTFTPSNIGGDIYRFSYLKRKEVSNYNTILILFVERVFGFIGLLLLSFFSLLFLSLRNEIYLDFFSNSIKISFIIIILFFLVNIFFKKNTFTKFIKIEKISIFNSQIYNRINNFIIKIKTVYKKLKKRSIIPIFLTLISFILWTLVFVFISEFLNFKYSFYALLATASLTEIIRIIPIGIQGIGIREFSFATIYSNFFGFAYDDGFIISIYGYLILSIILVISPLIGKFLCFLEIKKKKIN